MVNNSLIAFLFVIFFISVAINIIANLPRLSKHRNGKLFWIREISEATALGSAVMVLLIIIINAISQ